MVAYTDSGMSGVGELSFLSQSENVLVAPLRNVSCDF
jgi:hypothetical protein